MVFWEVWGSTMGTLRCRGSVGSSSGATLPSLLRAQGTQGLGSSHRFT